MRYRFSPWDEVVQANHRYEALDALRGVCALAVAVYHIDAVSAINSTPIIKNAFLFVDFFFVLSGFVIAANYQTKLQNGFATWRFMFLRFGRLYPLHLFLLLLFAVVAAAKTSDGSYPPSGFLISALLLQPFSDGAPGNWNLPSWSIAAEMWTYAIFAILCYFSSTRALLAWLALIIIAAIPVLILTSDRYIFVCYRPGGLIRCLYGFSFGVLTFAAWQAASKFPRSLSFAGWTILEAGAAIVSLALVSFAGGGYLSLLCPPVFASTVLVFAREGGAISGALKLRLPVLVGALSYSIYMTHEFAEARLVNVFTWLSHKVPLPIEVGSDAAKTISSNFPLVPDLVVLVMICAVVFVSYLSFRFIEEPFRVWSKSVGQERAPLASRVPAV